MTEHRPLLRVERAVFSYGGAAVLNGLDLEVEAGGICCLMGPNGCGKSTLVDAILGLNRLQAGQVYLHGHPILDYRPSELARQLAYVPQAHNPTFPYTVRQVVAMGRTAYLGAFSGPDAADEALAEQALERLGLIQLAERPYTRLSGGELQLVLLARALVQQTPLILLDEPTAHLDLYHELRFLDQLAALTREKVTVLLTTHRPDQVFYLQNRGVSVRAALMCKGRVACEGEPQTVLSEENMRRFYHIQMRLLSVDGGSRRVAAPLAALAPEQWPQEENEVNNDTE